MRLISWNILRGGGKRISAQASALAQRKPDVVALQEVWAKYVPLYRNALAPLGLIHVLDTFTLAADRSILVKDRRDGLLIASRWPLTALPPTGFVIPYHERVLSATINSPFGQTEVHNVHLPNGSEHGRVKVKTFEGIYERLEQPAPPLRLLCGDFNSPKEESVEGLVLTAGQHLDTKGRHKRGDYKRAKDQPYGSWAKAEHSVIEGLAAHDLQDVFRRLHRYVKQEFSFTTTRLGVSVHYRFDHIFASAALNPVACKYLHELRADGLSDHSPIEADFKPHTTQAAQM